MPLVLPQARDFDRMRLLLGFIRDGIIDTQALGERLGAKPKYARRHADYYRKAARILGLLEPNRPTLTARGLGLLATKPNTSEEASLLRAAVEQAESLGELRPALLSAAAPDVDALVAYGQAETGAAEATVRRRVADTLSWRSRLGVSEPPVARSMRRNLEPPTKLIIPDEWPDPELLPHNWSRERTSVKDTVYPDLADSKEALLIMGYTSLLTLCEYVGDHQPEQRKLRVVFGTEPFEGRRVEQEDAISIAPEVRDYWLARGISILKAASVIRTIAQVESGNLTSRVSRRAQGQHAKMFLGESAVTLGSSNFTEPGLVHQLEANLRATAADDPERFSQAWLLGENYWDLAVEYNDQLLALLNTLVQHATWQEALARAASELLDGSWARDFLQTQVGWSKELWPSQVEGIAQALYVLMDVGAVLIADATGSGKTRTGAWLMKALRQRLVSTGRPISDPVMICPPAVREGWLDELDHAGIRITAYSHGGLSNRSSKEHQRVVNGLNSARVLGVDEAHNFINRSQRSNLVNLNFADYIALFTATPINRDASDLLGIASLLGPDNLDEETLKILEETSWRATRQLTKPDLERLRDAVKRFTVRRTKDDFNKLIERAPSRYVNAAGVHCRYPTHVPAYYDLNESVGDRELAAEITRIARSLKGLLMLGQKPIALNAATKAMGFSPESYVSMRLASAPALARYQVRSALRSSGAALLEHLRGTDAARLAYKLRNLNKSDSGDVIGRLHGMRKKGPKESRLKEFLPEWLRSKDAFRDACADEITKYEHIADLLPRLSPDREEAKADRLKELLKEHQLVVAFDSRPTTLSLLSKMLGKLGCRHFIATGTAGQQKVMQAFRLGASTNSAVALCSNAMAEGINLQQASAVVHLNMPSVVRIAEQRVGRIDRMDSPHGQVESWWPRDAPEFALSTDEKLAARLDLVDEVLGSNLQLPSLEEAEVSEVIAPETMVKEMAEEERRQIELLDDAFAPVRNLVTGSDAIVAESVYEQIRSSKARVLSSVSVVRSTTAWLFVALPAGDRAPPRWVFIDELSERPKVSLDAVSHELRRHLAYVVEADLDDRAMAVLAKLVAKIQQQAFLLLPQRKQRAFQQMSQVLREYFKQLELTDAEDRGSIVRSLVRALDRDDGVDVELAAEGWLAAIQERWRVLVTAPASRRRRSLRRLKDLTPSLIKEPLSVAELDHLRASLVPAPSLEEKVVAAIVGVARGAGP